MSNDSFTIDVDEDLFDHSLRFRLIIWGYAGMALSLSGIIGNIISIFVLISPSMRTISTNNYLTALYCSNILYLIIFIPFLSLRYMLYYRSYMTNESSSVLVFLLKCLPILTPMYHTILLSIIYLTIAVSMDRLILIKFSFRTKQLLTQRTILIIILSIYIFSIIYCIPFWFEQQYDSETNQCRLTNIGKTIHKYIRVYIYIPVFCLIPLITLTYINITIIQNLIAKRHHKKHLGVKTNKRKSADSRITLMLVIVIIVSVLCYIPLTALHAWYAYDPSGTYHNLLFHLFYVLGEFVLVVNASTNFLLYCFFGEKFREILIEFILHFIPNYQRQRNLQIRLSETQKQRISQISSEQKQRISTGNSLTINDWKKSTDLNNTLNQKNQQELSPLMIDSEEISVINEDFSFKHGQNVSLHTDGILCHREHF